MPNIMDKFICTSYKSLFVFRVLYDLVSLLPLLLLLLLLLLLPLRIMLFGLYPFRIN
jgi:hypothetical protein